VRASATPRPPCGSWRAAGPEARLRARAAGLLIGVVCLALPAAAAAQPVSGFYVGGALGGTWTHGPSTKFSPPPGFTPAPVPAPSTSTSAPIGQGSAGYGLGNGLRFELEGSGAANRLRLPQGP
jgi:hypothetical protein